MKRTVKRALHGLHLRGLYLSTRYVHFSLCRCMEHVKKIHQSFIFPVHGQGRKNSLPLGVYSLSVSLYSICILTSGLVTYIAIPDSWIVN